MQYKIRKSDNNERKMSLFSSFFHLLLNFFLNRSSYLIITQNIVYICIFVAIF